MGSLTLKEICNETLVRCLFSEEDAFVSNLDSDVKFMVVAANKAVNELLNENWPTLVRTGVLDASAPDVSGGLQWTIATDAHHLVSDTSFSENGIREVLLPVSAASWAWRSTRNAAATLQYAFRLFGRKLTAVDNAPAADIRYEYISNRIILKKDSVATAEASRTASDYIVRFASDDDVFELDSELLIQDLEWRFARAKGMEGWQDLRIDFLGGVRSDGRAVTGYKKKARANATVSRTIRMGHTDTLDHPYGSPVAEQELGL